MAFVASSAFPTPAVITTMTTQPHHECDNDDMTGIIATTPTKATTSTGTMTT